MEEKKETRNMLLPKVLVVCPTSSRHGHLLDKWVKHLDLLSYPNFDVMLIDNTIDSDKYFKRLQTKKLKNIILQVGEDEKNRTVFERKIIVQKHEWDQKKQHPIQMLADCREKIRQYFVEQKEYSYLFHLDDDIFIPTNGIQRLLAYKKDCVGYYVHVFPKGMHKPCVFKSSGIFIGKGLDYYSFAEINSYKAFVRKFKASRLTNQEKHLIPFLIKDLKFPQLIKVYAVGLGCLLTSRKVMEAIQFRSHPSFVYGEDLWFFKEATEKGFEFYCDTDIRPRHENTDWSIVRRSPKEMGFALAIGPENPKGIDIIKRTKNSK